MDERLKNIMGGRPLFMWATPSEQTDMENEKLKSTGVGTTRTETTRTGTTEFTADDPAKIGTGAIKYDGGKPALWRGIMEYFPRAIQAVGEISTFGASKYAWAGWESVEDGVARYSDAMVRHLAKEGAGELNDPDSGLLHAAHAAWGAMARLELILREMDKKDVED